MGKNKTNSLFFFIFLLLLSFHIRAQDIEEKIPLETILTKIENQFVYKFNYAQDVVSTVLITAPDYSLSLQEILTYLNQKSGLIFTILDDKFISIERNKIAITLSLCGYLKDKDTQEVIPFVTIQGKKKSTITDENGYFELSIENANEEIIIRHLGYKIIKRAFQYFKKNDCGDIYLISQEQTLSEVVLSNYIVKGINKLSDGSFTIDFSKFTILPGLIEADVLYSMQAFPGIQSINETVSNINIRGGSHDQNLILWDDIKMYQSGHFFGLISIFNPQITQKVSLQKNGTNTSYTDGVSGTISMKTNQSINPKFKANIGVNFISVDGFADIPIGNNSSIQIAARKALNDFIKTPTYEEYFNRISQDTEVENNNIILNSGKEFDFYDTSVRWLYNISDTDKIQLNFINATNELIFNENAIIDDVEESRQSSISQNSIAGGFRYNRTWSDRVQTEFHIYETDYKLKGVNANILDNQRFLQENIVSETGIKAILNYSINDKFILETGYNFIETKVTNVDDVDSPRFRSLISEVVRTHGIFSQIGYKSLNRKTNIYIGIRVDYLDKFNKQLFEPRLSFNQKFLSNFNVEVLGELKHQITSHIINSQNDFLGIEKRRWQLSNDDDIPIIMSEQASLSLNYSKKGLLISAEGYYKNVDGITTQSQGFQNQYEFVKTAGSYEVIGADFLIRKQFNKSSIWVSYSYMDNEYTFSSLPETMFPSNFDITHAITVGTTYTNKGLKVSAGLNWHTGKPTTIPVIGNEIIDETINYSITNNNRLDDYLRVDLSASYTFKLGKRLKVNTGISVWNILDEQNTINNFYSINNDAIAEEFAQNSLGLTSNAIIRVYF